MWCGSGGPTICKKSCTLTTYIGNRYGWTQPELEHCSSSISGSGSPLQLAVAPIATSCLRQNKVGVGPLRADTLHIDVRINEVWEIYGHHWTTFPRPSSPFKSCRHTVDQDHQGSKHFINLTHSGRRIFQPSDLSCNLELRKKKHRPYSRFDS